MLRIAAISLLAAQMPASAPPELHDESAPDRTSSSEVGAECRCAKIPAQTVVEIAIDADIGSKLSKSGQFFPIHLTRPIVIDAKNVVAAGTSGMGEVVHAKKGSGSGAPGELVLAARYLEVGGRRLPLRSMHLSGVGADKIGSVNALAIASVTSPIAVALLGFLMTGGEKTVAQGSRAEAKTAVEFSFDTAVVSGAPALPASIQMATGGENK